MQKPYKFNDNTLQLSFPQRWLYMCLFYHCDEFGFIEYNLEYFRDEFFKYDDLQFMDLDRAERTGIVNYLSRRMAQHRDQSFERLKPENQRQLLLFGIDKKEWDLIRTNKAAIRNIDEMIINLLDLKFISLTHIFDCKQLFIPEARANSIIETELKFASEIE